MAGKKENAKAELTEVEEKVEEEEEEEEEVDEEWQHCYARELLVRDLLSGAIPIDSESMKPSDAYLQRPEYVESDPEYRLFSSRLRALRKQLTERHDLAAADSAALAHDRQIHPKKTHNYRGEPRWEGSEAERLLREDMDEGKHETMKPMKLYQSRPEYKQHCFTVDVFRGHIHQEVRHRKFMNYLEYKQEKDKKKEQQKRDKAFEKKENEKQQKKKMKAEKKKRERKKQEKIDKALKKEEEKAQKEKEQLEKKQKREEEAMERAKLKKQKEKERIAKADAKAKAKAQNEKERFEKKQKREEEAMARAELKEQKEKDRIAKAETKARKEKERFEMKQKREEEAAMKAEAKQNKSKRDKKKKSGETNAK